MATLLLHAGIAVCLRLWLFSLMMTAFNLAAFAWTWRASEPPVKPGRPPRIQGREPEPKEGVAHEDSPLNPTPIVAWRPAVEQRALSTPGVRGIVVRPGVVYGQGTGTPAMLGASVKDGGAVRYVGTGENPWAVVFVDALALDQRFTPEKAQKLLGWAPRGPAFLDELRTGSYARR
ncbi:hypothetical protein ACQKGO_07535 [Corallococcus interemptor]|uniref:hypothetical protein n=1 Tax=Corallococcus interemptor TaxID=2316720 RepID=UPI003CFEDF2E